MYLATPRCSGCLFAAGPGPEPASSAFVLATGSARVGDVLATHAAATAAQALPGVAAYCTACAQVTWLARHDELQAALLDSREAHAEWTALWEKLA